MTATARRADRLAELAAETGCEVVDADTTSDKDVAALVKAATSRGAVHALVNCAGGAVGMESVAASALAEWTSQYDVNVVGTVRVTQAFLPALRESGRGDVVVVTSTAGIEPYEGGAGYVAAKAAEHAMVRTLRLELTGTGVRVIEMPPGWSTPRSSASTGSGRPGRGGRGLQGHRAPRRRGRRRCDRLGGPPPPPRERGPHGPAPAGTSGRRQDRAVHGVERVLRPAPRTATGGRLPARVAKTTRAAATCSSRVIAGCVLGRADGPG